MALGQLVENVGLPDPGKRIDGSSENSWVYPFDGGRRITTGRSPLNCY
jgi:hypothetical protein